MPPARSDPAWLPRTSSIACRLRWAASRRRRDRGRDHADHGTNGFVAPFAEAPSGGLPRRAATSIERAMSERNFLDTVVDRTLDNLRSLRTAWRDIAASARDVLSGAPRPDLSRDDAEHLREQFRECLAARGGAVSTRARAADLGRTYLALNATGRERF